MQSVTIAFQLSEDDIPRYTQRVNPSEGQTTISAIIDSFLVNVEYDYVCIPLTNEQWHNRWQEMCIDSMGSHDRQKEHKAELWRSGRSPLHENEVILGRLEESTNVIALASEWICLDAPDEWVRLDSELALGQELSWASYLNIGTVILPPPQNRECLPSYARAVSAALNRLGTSRMELSIRIPIFDPRAQNTVGTDQRSTQELVNLSWETWDLIRSVCDYNPRLSLTLDMGLVAAIPPLYQNFERWAAEPIRHIMLPASCFVSNPKGYPVLSKPMQQFLRSILKYRPTIILTQADTALHPSGGSKAYSQYIKHLEKTSPEVIAQETQGTLENFTLGWGDYLQAPLQPLQDNLASATYETFEQCPIKYRRYEEAIGLAVNDRKAVRTLNIYVVGAGRGPLVDCALRSLDRLKRSGTVWALDKNPNAYITLQQRKKVVWGKRVNILFGDMRLFPTPLEADKADIMVSELLGSLGDNELSPECLDGAMRFLKGKLSANCHMKAYLTPVDGISIPSSYTAFIAPISSSKLFMEARNRDQLKDLETPYVVAIHAFDFLSGENGGTQGAFGGKVQECWEFEHPRKDALSEGDQPMTNSHNVRSTLRKFHIPNAGTLHGFAGFFEAVLYGNVGLSTHPDRMESISPNMTSWFPLFIPLRHPLYLPSNSELHVSLWRLTDKSRVWYEWYAESFLSVPLATPVPFAPLPSINNSSPTPKLGIFSTPTRVASPLIDATSPIIVTSDFRRNSQRSSFDSGLALQPTYTLLKIGQTAHHNPGGRSSFIGL